MEKITFTAYGAEVTGYLHGVYEQMYYHRVRPAIVICPGGAYAFLCDREADPPALHFFAKGYNVFILHYGRISIFERKIHNPNIYLGFMKIGRLSALLKSIIPLVTR